MTSFSNFLKLLPSLNTDNRTTAERAFGFLAELDGITLHDRLQHHRLVDVSVASSTRCTSGRRNANTAGQRTASTAGRKTSRIAGERTASTIGRSTGSRLANVGETNHVESSLS